MKWALLSLVLFAYVWGQPLGDFDKCGQEFTLATSNNNHQQSVVYNSMNNEYFVVYIEEVDGAGDPETSVVARRLARDGTSIGGKIPIYTYGQNPNGKHNPYVAYNPKDNLYVVLFEYDFNADGSDVDIIGVTVLANGTILGGGDVAATNGIDDRPSLAYNPDRNEFLFVYENDVVLNVTYNATVPGNATAGINDTTTTVTASGLFHFAVVGRMDRYGIPIPEDKYDPTDPFPYVTAIILSSHDSRPHASYDTDLKKFLVVFSQIIVAQFRIVVGVFSTDMGVLDQTGTIIGDLELQNGTRVSSHNAQAYYCASQKYHFVVYEVDVNGNEIYNTDVIATPVDPVGGFNYGFETLGGNLPRNRNPSFGYSSRTDDFLVAFEADQPGSGVVDIRATVLSAKDLNRHQEIVYVNRLTHNEHHPKVAYNSQESIFLTVWNDGFEPEDNYTTKRNIPSEQSHKFVSRSGSSSSLKRMKSNSEYQKQEFQIQTLTGHHILSEREQKVLNKIPYKEFVDVVDAKVDKRVLQTNVLSGTLLCASSSTTGNILQPTTQQYSGGPNRTVVAIAVVVAIFGVVIILLAVFLVYLLVIRPKRENAKAMKMRKFDPDSS